MRRYLIASGVLGVIACWGSENLFWTTPRSGLDAGELLLTWLCYAWCAAAALSAVLLSGVRGWPAVFLGGALLGFGIEGVVVNTMYDAFPFQVVWTPLAWHALVTGVLVFGLGRASGHWPWPRQLGAWLLVGIAVGGFGWYWPAEVDVASLPRVAAYLVGLGCLVPLAQLGLDRLAHVERPARRWPLLIAPGGLALAWAAEAAASLNPLLLTLPVVVAATYAVMARLGDRTVDRLELHSSPGRRHWLFLAAPAATTAVAWSGWQLAPGGLPDSATVTALVTGIGSLALYARLVWRAALRSPAAGTA